MESKHNLPSWQHHNPVRIIAGAGVLDQLPQHITGSDVLLVTSPGFTKRGVTARIQSLLKSWTVAVYDRVSPNPDLDDLDKAAAELRGRAYATIVALGGGSVLDSAKALRAAFTSEHPTPLALGLRDSRVHKWSPGIPLIAIPTTAGTGSEVTPFATVWDRAECKKHSITGPSVYPEIALLDPECALSLPESETLYSGLDTISHAMESLWNRHRTPISSLWAAEALRLATDALPSLLEQPDDLRQRTRMQEAALLAGLAISQTRTAIAHAISYPLTLRFDIPHGLACGFTLPAIYQQVDLRGLDMPVERDILQAAVHIINALGVRQRIESIIALDALQPLRHEMNIAGRSDNFLLPITNELLDTVLSASIS